MEILFRQKRSAVNTERTMLSNFGIEQCLFKNINFEKDRLNITRKEHYHTSIEIHIIEKGYQVYEVGSESVRVDEGQFLLIPSLVKHIAVEEDPCTVKYAFTFVLGERSPLFEALENISPFLRGETPALVTENIRWICEESERGQAYHFSIIGSRVWECILQFFRLAGIKDALSERSAGKEKNERFLMAMQYIEDNICRNISVPELASYCCMSEKQLERIFMREAGVTVMDHVREKRCRQIEKLLADPNLSLREISEIMNFNNEYYFNAFFKKHSGMTPGAYRRFAVKQ